MDRFAPAGDTRGQHRSDRQSHRASAGASRTSFTSRFASTGRRITAAPSAGHFGRSGTMNLISDEPRRLDRQGKPATQRAGQTRREAPRSLIGWRRGVDLHPQSISLVNFIQALQAQTVNLGCRIRRKEISDKISPRGEFDQPALLFEDKFDVDRASNRRDHGGSPLRLSVPHQVRRGGGGLSSQQILGLVVQDQGQADRAAPGPTRPARRRIGRVDRRRGRSAISRSAIGGAAGQGGRR